MRSSNRRRVCYLIIAGGVLCVAWLGRGYLLPDRSPQPSAQDLRGVLAESDSQAARADAAARLGQMRDEESMSALLESMEDPDPVIRGRAAAAVRKVMGADYYFRADDPPQRRKQVIAIIKKQWEGYLRSKNRQTTASSDSRGLPQ